MNLYTIWNEIKGGILTYAGAANDIINGSPPLLGADCRWLIDSAVRKKIEHLKYCGLHSKQRYRRSVKIVEA